MAAEAYNLGHVDEVWMVPCGSRTDKKLGFDGNHRLEMVNMLISDFFPPDFPIKVFTSSNTSLIPFSQSNDIEIQNKESIPTYFLMKKFIEDPNHRDKEFYFILGSDLLSTIRSWDEGDKLVEEINFIVFIRIGFRLDPEVLPKKYIIVNTTFVASCSTDIRNRVKNYCKKHHNHKKLVRRPTIPKSYSFVVEKSFPKLPELDPTIQERTIDNDEISVDDTRLELETKYLGILGIVPLQIIDYIREHHLYCEFDHKEPEYEAPKKKIHAGSPAQDDRGMMIEPNPTETDCSLDKNTNS